MKEESATPHAPAAEAPTPVKIGRFLLLTMAIAVGVATTGVASRLHDEEKLARWTDDQATPTVALTSPQHEDANKEVVLPGDVEAYYSASIHGQASGYVHDWRADIGAKVKQGDILAVVDTPELDQRVTQAEGELAKAKANQALAKLTAERWKTLSASSAVSQQAIDEKEGDAIAKDAEVAAVKANLDRLRALKAFANITAPFDGVVTARNVDIGSLVLATGAASQPLFAVADIHKVRIYVRAPESYAAALTDGMKAKFIVPEYPGRSFEAAIATTSRSIDPKSRSLLVELMADNSTGLLSPGSFAEVRFELPPDPNATRLPANALIFRNQAVLVAKVDKDDRVRLIKVHIARDYGSQVEIADGLPAGARIIVSPPESIADGDQVRVAAVAVATADGGPATSRGNPVAAQAARE